MQPLNGWHFMIDGATGAHRWALYQNGLFLKWAEQQAKASPPAPAKPKEPLVQNYGVSMQELRKQTPIGWTNGRGEAIESPAGPTIGAGKALGQQVNWPTVEQARGFDPAPYIAPGIVILSALWLILHPHKGKR